MDAQTYLRMVLPTKFHDHVRFDCVETIDAKNVKINLHEFLPENSLYSPFGKCDPQKQVDSSTFENANEKSEHCDTDALEAYRARIGTDVEGHTIADIGAQFRAWPSFLHKIPQAKIQGDTLTCPILSFIHVHDFYGRVIEIWPVQAYLSKSTSAPSDQTYKDAIVRTYSTDVSETKSYSPLTEHVGEFLDGKPHGKGQLFRRNDKTGCLYLHIDGTFGIDGNAVQGILYRANGSIIFDGYMQSSSQWNGALFHPDGMPQWYGQVTNGFPSGNGFGHLWNSSDMVKGTMTSEGFFGIVSNPLFQYHGHLNTIGERHGTGELNDFYMYDDKRVHVLGNFMSNEFTYGTMVFAHDEYQQIGLFQVFAFSGPFQTEYVPFLQTKCSLKHFDSQTYAFYIKSLTGGVYKIVSTFQAMRGGIGQMSMFKCDYDNEKPLNVKIAPKFNQFMKFLFKKTGTYIGSTIKRTIGEKFTIRKIFPNGQEYNGYGNVSISNGPNVIPDGHGCITVNGIRRFCAIYNNGTALSVVKYYDETGCLIWQLKSTLLTIDETLEFTDFPHRLVPKISALCTASVYDHDKTLLYTAEFKDHKFTNIQQVIASMPVKRIVCETPVECPISTDTFQQNDLAIVVNDILTSQDDGTFRSKYNTFLTVDTFETLCTTTMKDPFRGSMPCFRFHVVKITYANDPKAETDSLEKADNASTESFSLSSLDTIGAGSFVTQDSSE